MLCIPLATRHRTVRRNELLKIEIGCKRDRDTPNNPIFVHESSHYRQGGLMVWAGISTGGYIDLLIIRKGNLTAQK
ncbi:hypothetical protein TNCV_4081 [Trichonephila clavipes]|nr:hypothetical protein TNCV_4081 [Trichonephila clavipes]